MTPVKEILLKSLGKKTKELYELCRSFNKTAVFNMQWADRTIVASGLQRFVYICQDYVTAKEAYRQIKTLRDDAVYLPSKDDVLTYVKSRSVETAFSRLSAMHSIVSGKSGAVVTSVEAVMQLFPNRKEFISSAISLVSGEEYAPEILIECLIYAGYKRETQITDKGQFARRGDIVDISPINYESGLRLEFFGDELESIKTIDFLSQTSKDKLEGIEIAPACEFFAGKNSDAVLAKMKEDAASNLCADAKNRIDSIISEIEFKLYEGLSDVSMSYVLPYANYNSFWQFLGGGFTVVLDEVKKINIKMVYGEHQNRYKQLLARGEVLSGSINQLCEAPFETVKDLHLLGFYKNPTASDIFMAQESLTFNSMPLPLYTKDRDALVSDVRLWSDKGMQVLLFCGSVEVRERLAETFREKNLYFGYDTSSNICLLEDELYKGAVLFDCNTVLIGTYDLISKKAKKTIKRSRKDVFSQPQIGEYVVHEVHGIGVCESVEKLESGGASRDYLVIRYRDGDKLFVPVESMDTLSKYNSGEESPSLNKIGGTDFFKVKERVRSSVKKLAFDLLKLYAQRSMEKGVVYQPYEELMEEFADSFPFTETEDQMIAIEEGLKDLREGKIMDRLLCGDVGYGKTEVALRIAYNVILGGKQVAFISPTTILARQHYQTAKERMESLGVRIGSLTRLNSTQDINNTVVGLAQGKVDIVVGTHRVLSKDIQFKDLGLLILDEEQRFGVADKEKIKLLKKNVNVLSLSATPIPRTLHMSMTGIRDISILDTPPVERIPIQTYVTEYTDSLLIDAVSRELNRGGQVFIVYNRVASIDSFAAGVQSLVGVDVSVIHGQMPEKQMEDTLSRFTAGETSVLIASTIIENGIDMPKANTMIVIDSDKLGLSQLYQLRGRIGRSNRLAYVFFTYDASKVLTETAYKRLESINEFTEFGSGFKIAMRDLQIRGVGNIMGREQHGHMEKVGYDMYRKILTEELEKLKGVEVKVRKDVRVSIDFDAFIPERYIADSDWRLKVYSRISHIENPHEIERLESELRDIYGPVPKSVLGLCKVALIKNLAAKADADSVTYNKNENSITYKRVIDIPSSVVDKINSGKTFAKLEIKYSPSISFGKGEQGEKNMLEFLLG